MAILFVCCKIISTLEIVPTKKKTKFYFKKEFVSLGYLSKKIIRIKIGVTLAGLEIWELFVLPNQSQPITTFLATIKERYFVSS